MTRNAQDVSLKSSVGRALYNRPFKLWSTNSTNDTQLASFSTSFTFSIRNLSVSYGDGLTFLMTSGISPPPAGSAGGWLGLVTAATNGNYTNRVVAVEFDTYLNDDPKTNFSDIDDNHVGIDVNDIISQKSVSLYSIGVYLKSGDPIKAWIDYDGTAMRLDVYVSYNTTKPSTQPLLSYNIDLSQYLLQDMYVGFSGATGSYVELHSLLSWSFTGKVIDGGFNSTGPIAPAWSTKVIAAVVSLCCVLIVLGVGLAVWYIKSNRRKKMMILMKDTKMMEPSMINLKANFLYGPRKFTYRELSAATNNFSEKLVLGRGGFGSVYKGVLQADGTIVAVKRTSKSSSQGEREFVAEVSIIGRLRHRNLVELIGWCHEKGELLLVYEFMPNGSLDKVLFSSDAEERLDWNRRYDIACGLASALLYLHEEWEQQVVHRDVKASNVMLDANFTARLGDFGLARLIDHNQNPETTIAAGTMGYVAPEVSQTGKATTKSDVYSYGIVALEVACGRRPIDRSLAASEAVLLDWVWQLHAAGRITDAADVDKEKETVDLAQVRCLLQLGLACSHPDPNSRPSIRQVLQILKGDATLAALPLSKPIPSYAPYVPCSIQDLLAASQHALDPTPHPCSATTLYTDSVTSSSSTSTSLITGIALPR
ncbi:hypothetical protein O6H91_06G080100 [Diphasiastrum complanatum]|nr:hypothetical protein O6H91_06G080100 [Diphasiastrum complanatum]